MGLFSSKKKYATVSTKDIIKPKKVINNKTVASNLWEKCDECGEIIYKQDIEKNLKKCPNCDHYFPMKAFERIELLIDNGTFFVILSTGIINMSPASILVILPLKHFSFNSST